MFLLRDMFSFFAYLQTKLLFVAKARLIRLWSPSHTYPKFHYKSGNLILIHSFLVWFFHLSSVFFFCLVFEQVGHVTTICLSCFLVRCIMMSLYLCFCIFFFLPLTFRGDDALYWIKVLKWSTKCLHKNWSLYFCLTIVNGNVSFKVVSCLLLNEKWSLYYFMFLLNWLPLKVTFVLIRRETLFVPWCLDLKFL